VRPRALTDVAGIVSGRLDGADATVTAIATDSRSARPGALFVALLGERYDGHAFVPDAFARGAVAAVVRTGAPDVDAPTIRVDHPAGALRDLARAERAEMRAIVVGITGANGKTSTKDLTTAVLSTRARTHGSPASFNNEIGVPLTILGAEPETEALVVEMGARRVGDAAALSALVRPDIVVVTNVGVAHFGVFGSREAIERAAAEPIDALERDGVAVVNADDAVVRRLESRTAARRITFGTADDADVRAAGIELDDAGHASFTLVVDDQREPVTLAVAGEHMVSNALAASAVGVAIGMTGAECAAALKDAGVSAWRMQTFAGRGGLIVVNDAYNANPESMSAGLRTARWMARGRRLIAVLGHMAELGPISADAHDRLGELATRLRVDRLITVGEDATPIALSAVREGMEPDRVSTARSPEDAAGQVLSFARGGDVVFLKGSRVAGLERAAEALR
jgi:UDP-N-acetylmuramoyl-tripeptide--D-alanyl-D-alanine ligase